jgi:hypothetical protein
MSNHLVGVHGNVGMRSGRSPTDRQHRRHEQGYRSQ